MDKYTQQEKECFTYKFINDPVYGSIGVSKLETDLINTPAFQRLRHLKQLGFASYVFPGGEHSRFVHSLGVLYIIGRMCEQLESRELGTDKLFSREDTVKLRIAALLHDIGHYPLSHLGEYVFQYEAKLLAAKDANDSNLWELDPSVSKDTAEDDKKPDNNPLLFDMAMPIQAKQKKAAHHEMLGLIVVTHNSEIKSILQAADIDPALIGDIFSRGARQPENTIYYNLLHSSLDADRLDYLLRDSAQTGVKFGMVDLDYLIRLIMVKKVPLTNAGDNMARIIVYNKKGQHVIEHFLMCRYFHYAQVVCHRTSGAFEMIAKALFVKILQSGKFVVSTYKTLFEAQDGRWFVDTPDFLRFTDEEWWHVAAEIYNDTDDQLYKTFFDVLQKRIPPRTLYYESDILSYSRRLTFTSERKEQYFLRKRVIERKLPSIAESLELDTDRIGYCVGIANIEKDAHKINSDTLNVDDEEMMDCIKIVSPSESTEKCTLLAKDEGSMISQVADLYTESINVFYVPQIDERIDEDRLKIALRELLDE